LGEASWSDSLKIELVSADVRSQCCRRAIAFGMLFSARIAESGEIVLQLPNGIVEFACHIIKEQFTRDPTTVSKGKTKTTVSFESRSARIMIEKRSDYKKYLKCSDCLSNVIKGIFIACGSMNSPDKESYLQIAPTDNASCLAAKDIALDAGVDFFVGERRGKSYLYVKRRQSIEDVLAVLKAKNSYFIFLNAGISKQTRGDANRASNCITSNIKKVVKSSGARLALIKEYNDMDMLSVLPPELCETARLLLKNPSVSLVSLGALHNPPVSKSGIYHRLRKIEELLSEDKRKR